VPARGYDAQAMIHVIGVDHINIRVADLDRALRFYQEVIGLPEVRRNTRRDGSPSLVALRAGSAIVFLQPASGYTPPADPRQSGLDHYSLEIEQTPGGPDAFAAWLREQGVPIDEGPVKRNGAHGDGTSIYVQDPDGHRIELKQYNLG
jgi:catechol 2,3-dioxygenase-like lactoylglutathione lyase family enzyme